jgi:hypothetical protein
MAPVDAALFNPATAATRTAAVHPGAAFLAGREPPPGPEETDPSTFRYFSDK